MDKIGFEDSARDSLANRDILSRPPTGFRMIDRFATTGFRCFDQLRLFNLTRVNVVTGANASGKSALLEALYIAVNASAQAIQNIAVMRGVIKLIPPVGLPVMLLPGIAPQVTLPMYFEGFFRTVPKNGSVETAKEITFAFADSNHTTYELNAAYQQAGTAGAEAAPVVRPTVGGATTAVPMIFARKKTIDGQDHFTTLPITVDPIGRLQHPPAEPFGPTIYIFSSELGYEESDNVMWFSQLKERGEAEKVISFFRTEFPFVENIEVLAPQGQNALYATLKDGTRRRIQSVSYGMQKLISILVSTMHARNGIIIIDEIENGIFYEKYSAVWRILYRFAKETGNQLFISSHSAECLKELPSVIGNNTDDFSLLRTERENGRCVIQQINGIAMEAALIGGNEIRGATNGIKGDNA